MKNINKPSKRYRSLLIGGGIAIAITSVLIACYGSCTRTRTDTDDTGSTSEVTTECTTTTTSTATTSTSTSSTTVESTTTTTTIETTMNVNTTLAQIETQPYVVATQPVVVEQQPVEASGDLPISDQDYILISNVVSHEAGSSWIGDWERSMIVSSIMNRVYDSRFPNTVDGVVHQAGQMFDVPYYRVDYSGIGYEPIDRAIQAYFNDPTAYGSTNSWYGNGTNNTFYTM